MEPILLLLGLAFLLSSLSNIYLALRPPSSRLERRLTTRVKQLELDWDMTFDKMEGLAGRLTKRAGLAKIAQAKIEGPPLPAEPQSRSGLLRIVLDKERNYAESKKPAASWDAER